MAIDVEKLLAEALAKHGVRLDPDDPAVVLVTLNRLVLEDAAESVATDIRKATREFEEAANQVQSRFGAAIAMSLKAQSNSGAFLAAWSPGALLALGAGSATGVFFMGIAVGRWLLR